MAKTLGDEIKRRMQKATLTIEDLAKLTGLTQSWIKAVRSDGIRRPRAAWLERVADETGGDVEALLALSNQLGAAHNLAGSGIRSDTLPDPADPDLYKLLLEQTKAITRLAEAIEKLTVPPAGDRGRGVARGKAAEGEAERHRERPTPSKRRSRDHTGGGGRSSTGNDGTESTAPGPSSTQHPSAR